MSECDWKLLARFSQHGEHTAFATLVRRYRPLVEATCTRILGSGSDADDVLQATFFQLARSAEQLTRDPPARRLLAPWLTRVATNICHDISRSRTARSHHEREYMQRSASATGSPTKAQLALVDELIAELPQQLREPLVLCYLQGIEQAQAAAQLGLTVGTLRRRIQSAKSLLRSRFAARGIPISMFLLHMLMDNWANAANALTSTIPAAPTAPQPPVPPNHLPPQVTQHPFASPLRRPAMSGGTSWAVKVGLIAASIGLTPVLYRVLSADAPAFATADAVIAAAPVKVDSAREPAPPVIEEVASPVVADPVARSEAPETPGPEIVDSGPSSEIDAAPEIGIDTVPGAAQQLPPVVESAGGSSEEPEVALRDAVPVPAELEVISVTSESELLAPQTQIERVKKKSPAQPRNVKELFGLEWHTTLPSASTAARRERARPIFCFRVLGDLSGFM